MVKRVSALLLALLLLTAGTANAGGVYYEIFPSSYRDTDGDGVGDLAGVTASAAYLQSLGTESGLRRFSPARATISMTCWTISPSIPRWARWKTSTRWQGNITRAACG